MRIARREKESVAASAGSRHLNEAFLRLDIGFLFLSCGDAQ